MNLLRALLKRGAEHGNLLQPLLWRGLHGGGGGDWKSLYVQDGLLMWLDGEHTGPNGELQATLETWYDQSGNGKDWTNNGAVPGLRGVSFDASKTQYLAMDGNNRPTGVAYIEVVFSTSASPNYQSILMGFGSNPGNIFLKGAKLAMRTANGDVLLDVEKDKVYSVTSTGVMNGEQLTPESGNTSWTALYCRIGAYNSSNTYRFTGTIYAIRLYSRVLTAAEIAQNQAADLARFRTPDQWAAIPDYFRMPDQTGLGYLDRRLAAVPKGPALCFITDTHWTGNQKHSTELLRYVRAKKGSLPVLFGGDTFGNAETKAAALNIMGSYIEGSVKAFREDFIPCVGDHDNNTVNVASIADAWVPYGDQAALWMEHLKQRAVCYQPTDKLAEIGVTPGAVYDEILAFFRTVYYVDIEAQRTRVIVLNCGNGGSYGAMYETFGTAGTDLVRLQIPFLVSTLRSTPQGWNVCVLAHKLSYGSSGPNTACAIIAGYKGKAAYVRPYPSGSGNANIEAWWPNNTSYNFSDAQELGFVFGLGGHNHIDVISVRTAGAGWSSYDGEAVLDQSAGAVPWITTATDAAANTESSGPTMTVGTVSEQCFDVITILPDGLALTRFGAGADRRVYMSLGGD